MKAKSVLVYLCVLVMLWIYWSIFLGPSRGDSLAADNAEQRAQEAEASAEVELPLIREEADEILAEFRTHFRYFGGPQEYPDRVEAFGREFCVFIEQELVPEFDTEARALSCNPSGGLFDIPESTQTLEVGLNVWLPSYQSVADWLHYLDDRLAIKVQSVNVKPVPQIAEDDDVSQYTEEEFRDLNKNSPAEVNTQLEFRMLTSAPESDSAISVEQ